MEDINEDDVAKVRQAVFLALTKGPHRVHPRAAYYGVLEAFFSLYNFNEDSSLEECIEFLVDALGEVVIKAIDGERGEVD